MLYEVHVKRVEKGGLRNEEYSLVRQKVTYYITLYHIISVRTTRKTKPKIEQASRKGMIYTIILSTYFHIANSL